MGIFKDITTAVSKAENQVDVAVKEAEEIIGEAMEGPGVRLGLGPQRNTNKQPARKGDIVLRVEVDGSLVPFVISDEGEGGEPLAKNSKRGEEISIIPELLVIGAMTNNPQLKAAAGRMATKYPDRRVFLYGDTKQKKESEQTNGEPVRAAPGHGNENPRMR